MATAPRELVWRRRKPGSPSSRRLPPPPPPAAAPRDPTFSHHCAQVAETWDSCIENTIRKLAYGTLGGGLIAVILFRARRRPRGARGSCRRRAALTLCLWRLYAGGVAARSAVAGLGAGVGIGMGYTECKHEFELVDKAAAAK